MDKNTFDLHHQYQLYLQIVGLSEASMHPAQKQETKRAFFGACGQMLVLMRDGISELEENNAVQTMEDLMNQVEAFWLAETNRKN